MQKEKRKGSGHKVGQVKRGTKTKPRQKVKKPPVAALPVPYRSQLQRTVKDQYSLKGIQWDREYVDFLKEVIPYAKDLTDKEFILYAFRARMSGLNPALGHLVPVKFKGSDGKETLSFITSIDGYRSMAENSRELAGIDDYTYNNGQTQFQVLASFKGTNEKIIPKTATCTVYRIVKGVRCPSTATVRWNDYLPPWESRQKMWWKFPFLMLGKCAEALALRKAFPHLFEGIRTDTEMEQATEQIHEVVGDRSQNVDAVNKINEGYSILGYNEAQKIATNVRFTGRNEIVYAPKESLDELLAFVQAEVAKLDNAVEVVGEVVENET